VEAVTTVGGNVTLDNTTRNALRILALGGAGGVPVYAGAPGPLRGDASEVHGNDGLLGAPLAESGRAREAEMALDYLSSRTAGAAPGSLTLATLGPLTNLAELLTARPEAARAFGEVVIMGGAFGRYRWTAPNGPQCSQGNMTEWAEFNIWSDPEAARIVCESDLNLVWIPLDCTHQTITSAEWLAALAALGERGAMLAGVLDRYADFSRRRWGTDGGPLHDPNVLVYLEAPELYRLEEGRVIVDDSQGPERGRTTLGPGRGHRVALGVDSGAYFDLLLKNVERALG